MSHVHQHLLSRRLDLVTVRLILEHVMNYYCLRETLFAWNDGAHETERSFNVSGKGV